ncbi:MAG: hypothetical protein KC415_23820, partial [Anaerolineales bacterium]|nr:hypothetical protein [Anaerolineales bacterium]
MKRTNRIYKITSALVTLSLLLQLFIPIISWPGATAVHATPSSLTIDNSQSTIDNFPNPIAIARAQSSYQAGGDLTVTYTVRNNHSAANLPEIAPGLNVTDTVAALSGFDPLADPNTLRNVIVSAELTNGAAFLDGSIWPDSDGSQLLFALGDIAPRADATFTVTISAPTAAADFLELDNGAMVYGTFQGRMATAVAPPIRLAPDGFADWLIKTPDADRDDEAMLFQVAQIGDDPLALFDFVQDLNYEAYDGSLRGTRGALWSAAGNSADQSSLLIAMLRATGVPARYRHGILPLADAQTLITGMFDDPVAIRGNVPAGTAVSDPINDPELLAIAQDHWWVEAYLPDSGWTDLDPTIAAAAPGDLFAAPATDGSDQIAELPDAIRHKLSFTLDVEKYGSFPIGGLNLTRNTVLTATIPTAQAAGVPVKIAFSVQSQSLNGLIFSSHEHTYTPYLTYGDSAETIFGSSFQDLLTSFPLATHYTTAIWLDVTSTAPDGRTDTYQRTIKDLIGIDVRQGGAVQLEPRGDAPLIKSSDLIQVQPIPNSAYPADEADRIIHSIFHQVPTMIDAYNAYSQLDDTSPPADIFAFTDDQLPALYDAQFTQLDLMSALFQYSTTWEGEAINAETMLVKSYPDRPKLILSSQIGFDDGSLQTSFELLNINERAIGYPGQNLEAVKSANFLRTTSEKTQEYNLLEQFLPGQARSAVGTLIAAAEQGIPTHFITAENLADLNDLNIPDETKARIANYVSDGSLVSVPEQMVSMPYGADIGFMVVASDGNASYVNADGYKASIMYALINQEVIVAALIEGSGLASVGGFMAYIFTFFAEAFVVFLDLPPTGLGDWPSAIAGGGPGGGGKGLLLGLILASKSALITTLGACGISPNPPGCQLGSLAGYGFVVTGVIASLVGGALDPSLPDFWVSDLPLLEPTRVSTVTVTAVPTLSGPVNLNITAGHYWGSSSSLSSDWASSHTQTAAFDTLSATADVFRDGTPLGSGSFTAVDGRIQFNDSARQWTLTSSGSAAGYGSAANGLAIAQVGDYAATASGSPALTGWLRSATAALNDAPIAGTLDIVFNSDAALVGSGAAPSPHFAAAHTLELTQGQFLASDIDGGTISVGGTAVNNVQSIALSNYTGAVALSDSGDVDQISLNGDADFFALTAAADTTNAVVNDGILITPDLLSNYNDIYTVTVSVPDGWTTGDISGGILVTPTAKAETGSAAVLVTAQSATHPDLFSSAIVLLTLAENQAVDVTVVPDPLVTVPMGTVQGSNYDLPLTLNHAGDGRAEISGAAFNVMVRNDSTAAATFDLFVAGLPAGWAVWSQGSGDQTSLTLASGAQQAIGLYVVPPAAPLPTAGTSYPFTVTATDQTNGSVTDSDSGAFTMPALPFPYLTADSLVYTAAPDELVAIPVMLQNVGNAAASFPITVTVRNNHFSTANVADAVLLSDAALDTGVLAPNAGFTTEMVITTTGTVPGDVFFVEARSAAGEYEPTAMTAVEIVSPLTSSLYQAGNSCNLGSDALTASFDALAYAVTHLENSCNAGDCDLGWRDAAVTAAQNVALYTREANRALSYEAIEAIAADMAIHTDPADLQADMAALGDAVTHLSLELCDLEEHQVSARFTPYVDAVLLGDSASFLLDVTNEGTLSTTYAITVTGLPDGDQFFNETIAAGNTANLPVNSTPAVLGTFDVAAEITAVGPFTLTPHDAAVARLNVVDKFIQVTQVVADPPFVETGVSSTTISVEIANISGVAQDGNARTAVIASNNAISFTQDIPLTALAGNPRWYELATVDTSGWNEGTYTVTVDILDDGDALIPDGSGYSFFTVGQGLAASQSISPTIVAPGNVTVTTVITTELTQVSLPVAPLVVSGGLGAEDQGLESYPVTMTASITRPLTPIYTVPMTETAETETETETAVSANASPADSPSSILSLDINSIYTRTEQSEPAVVYTGTWTSQTASFASGGGYYQANAAGETAAFTFSGDWLNIGFIAGRTGGQAEVFIDGVSQGVVDLYRRLDGTAVSYIYDNLINDTHTVTVTALSTTNPYATNDYIRLDYFDITNSSSALPDGTFEQSDVRSILAGGWVTYTNPIASGGSYVSDNASNVWFPFSGDSFSYHTLLGSGAGHTRLYVDGQFLTDLRTFNYDAITRTYSFDGFGPGPHLLQVSAYRGNTNVDAFTTPGIPPFDDPNPIGSYMRYEEDHPAWLYNGVPYTQTAGSWTSRSYGVGQLSSDDRVLFSSAAGNTAVITVNGQWINLGLGGSSDAGSADIYLDGVYQRTVDLYRRLNSVTNEIFPSLTPGNHTISVTVNGNGRVWLDYVDVWDGTTLPDGAFEEYPGRLYLSGGWSRIDDVDAINGSYLRNSDGTVWFPFTGDSVSYRAFAYSGADNGRLYLDDQFIGTLDLFSSEDISRTFSFEGLGSGVHILRLEQHRNNLTLEDFTTPGSAPYYTPPAETGITRYEEDHPALRYNGVPYTQTVASWSAPVFERFASSGYYVESAQAGDTASLTFDGTWVGIGFISARTRGMADIHLDGSLIDTVDLYNRPEDTASVYYGGLASGSHTITVTVRADNNPYADGSEIAIDYFDVWDGAAETDGTFEESDRDRLIYSYGWAQVDEVAASAGSFAYADSNSTVWFPFTGDSVTYQAWAKRNSHEVEIRIDGVPMNQNDNGRFDIFADSPITETISFTGLGDGPHMMEVRYYRYDATIDAFIAPGVAPFYEEPPASTAIVRYEEDHPALRYNGFPYPQTDYCSNCWIMDAEPPSSNAYTARTNQVGDWVELTFDGRWAGVGFGESNGIAEVFIDGSSVITVDLSTYEDVGSVYFDNLMTGTHTISVTAVSGPIFFDYFDVWNGGAMGEGWFDADLDDHNSPFHYSELNSWLTQYPTPTHDRIVFARDGDVVRRLPSGHNTHLWFGFTGNDLMLLPVQRSGKEVEVFIDGVSQGVVDLTPEYTAQPIALYYTDLGDGPHMVHLNAVGDPYLDAFQVNPPNFLPYTPVVEWMSTAPTDVYTTTVANNGLLSSAAIGDLDGDGLVEIVSPASNGQLYVYRGD